LLLTGVVLLAALLLVSMLRIERRKDSAGANAATRDMAAPSLSPAESAAEKARRAAIAALGPIKHKGVNAQDLYANASALYAGLTQEEKDELRHRDQKMDPAAAAALYAKLQPIMDMLRRARNADYVDWGQGPLTIGTSMTGRVQQAKELSQVALWESSYRFQSDPDGAVSDLAALVALGRDETDSMLGLVFENGFRTDAINLIAQNAGGISAAAGPDLADIINEEAARQSFENGMNGDVSELHASLAQYPNSAPPLSPGDPPMSHAQFASAVVFFETADRAIGSAALEPPGPFQQWWTQELGEAAALPEGETALKAQEVVIRREQASLVEDAMLAAGIALEKGDQAQFQSIVDPSTGQPFTYTQTASGIQLGSPTQYQGKPVSLTFSIPAPK
jgi:hypothetical protein